MNQSLKKDPYGFREYDARWLYEKDINANGITELGKGLGTQIIHHTKKNKGSLPLRACPTRASAWTRRRVANRA